MANSLNLRITQLMSKLAHIGPGDTVIVAVTEHDFSVRPKAAALTKLPYTEKNCWLDFEPTKGKKIGKYRPALVLSNKEYNKASGSLICCPMSTSIRGGATEVPIIHLDKPSA